MRVIKVKIPQRQTATRIVSVRFSASEYEALEAAASKADIKPATLIRAIVTQAIAAGIETTN